MLNLISRLTSYSVISAVLESLQSVPNFISFPSLNHQNVQALYPPSALDGLRASNLALFRLRNLLRTELYLSAHLTLHK